MSLNSTFFTTHGIYDTDEFCQNIITRRVYYSAPVFLDNLGYNFSVSCAGAHGGLIIFAHEPAVTLILNELKKTLRFMGF